MDLNTKEYNLVPIKSCKFITSPVEETLYDIRLEENHTFFVKLLEDDISVLVHNCDGNHITSMLIGWFRRFAPNLFKEGRICKLITPLIIVTDKKENIKEYFFDINSFKKWEQNNPNNKNKITYLKGLGSWDREKLIYLIDTYGLDNFIQEYSLDDESFDYIEDWLGSDSEKRKEYLRNYNLDIDKV